MQAPSVRDLRYARLSGSGTGHSTSFVTQLKRVERDLDEAQALLVRHLFEAARAKLLPHLSQLPDPLVGHVYLVLGQCAMRGAGHNWPALLHKARAAQVAQKDRVGLARTRFMLGTGAFARGDLSQAHAHVNAALEGFSGSRVGWGQAMTQAVLAQICLARHDLQGAMDAADNAVAMWAYLNEASEEAMARQIRAQLLASAGRMQDAARDLLWAERLVGPDACADVRCLATLGRAESLLWMGYTHRAAAALSRVAKHAESHPDICLQARYHKAQGQALMVDAPVVAAQHLNQAVETLRRLGQHYLLTQAQIYLTCCEHRLSMPTQQRLADIRASGVYQWPVLRDALASLEPLLHAPPGRLTGPQPIKVFDPEAIADAPQAYTQRPRAQPDGTGRTDVADASAADGAAARPWTQWVSRVQKAFGSWAQSGHIDVSHAGDAPSRTARVRRCSAAADANAVHTDNASAHPTPRTQRASPQKSRSEVTQA